jgi:hypothetical protein
MVPFTPYYLSITFKFKNLSTGTEPHKNTEDKKFNILWRFDAMRYKYMPNATKCDSCIIRYLPTLTPKSIFCFSP